MLQPRRKPYRTRDGRFYMRFGAEKREVSRSSFRCGSTRSGRSRYENIPLFTAEEKDFDDGLLWSFRRERFEDVSPTINLYQTADFLKKDLILAVGSADDFFPTVAALMLFGKNERVPELFPRSVVTVARYSGENGGAQLVEKIEVKGNLHTQYEAILAFIERYCDLAKDKPAKRGLHLVGAPSRGSFEAIISTPFERRSRTLSSTATSLFATFPTRITIYDNFIEFVNARRTQGFVPPASRAIRYGITQRLNPQIASIFTRAKYGTAYPARRTADGTQTIRTICRPSRGVYDELTTNSS